MTLRTPGIPPSGGTAPLDDDAADEIASRYGRPPRGSRPPLRETSRAAARDARSALVLLRERAWIAALLGVIVLSVIFVFLGRWQYHRHLSRTAKNDLISSNYAAAAEPLDQVLPAVRDDPAARVPYVAQWRSVSITGRYLTDDTVLIRNRPYSTGDNDSRNGYEVVVPFQVTGGGVVLVNRGWIPVGDGSALAPGNVPAPPNGQVSVVARLRLSEPASTRQAPPGQAIRINARQLATRLPTPLDHQVLNGYAVLAGETPAPAQPAPSELDPPDPGLGINLAYAVQWVLFAIAAYVLLGAAGVKEIRRRAAGGLIGRS